MDRSFEKRIQENKREIRVECMNLVLTKELAECLRLAAVREWGPMTIVSIKVTCEQMEEEC